MAKKCLLMCPPHFYNVSYEINPWMDTEKNVVHHETADEQWTALMAEIILCDAKVKLVKPVKNLPDLVFSAIAGLTIPGTKSVVLSTFLYPERQGEEQHWGDWFKGNGWNIYSPKYPFEGAGDALFVNHHLIAGHGFRSTRESYSEIAYQMGLIPIIVELKDPRFYHLDTCFCPLHDGDYLYFKGAFSLEDQGKLRSLTGKDGISVPEDEATKFACNAICIDRNVILPEGCHETEKMLKQAGYEPHPVAMTEYIKSGGACKCLTLEI